MPKFKGVDELDEFRQVAKQKLKAQGDTGTRIIVGMGTCGIAAGATAIQEAIVEALEQYNIDANVTSVGCIGMCSKEPLVDIEQAGYPRITYCNVSPDMVPRLIEEHLVKGHVVEDWVMGRVPIEGIGQC